MDRKPVIVYCTPSLYIPGGIERVLTTKANYLADVAGYTVYIILTDGQDKSPYYPLSSQIRLIQLGIEFYNPQIEMFARFKTKSSFHKTKRII